MSPRPDVSEERKQQILEAAIAVFARLGFRAARMDDVAEQVVGLSKAALYLYTKQGCDHCGAPATSLCPGVQTVASPGGIRAGRIGGGATFNPDPAVCFYDAVDEQAHAHRLRVYAIAGRDKEVRQFLKEYFADYRRLLARLIERGIAQGESRDIDAVATAITLTALFEGLALLFLRS